MYYTESMAIYTKTGDSGETSLFGGKRVLKCEELIDVYGSMDELNSWVGLVVAEIELPTKKDFLQKIQADLFVIGGSLAGWKADLSGLSTRVTEMEVEIDAMESSLPELKNFILPGGTVLASRIHLTRSICRRVERQVVALKNNLKTSSKSATQASSVSVIDESTYTIVIQYLNRLSDLFFMLARFINKTHGVEDIPWQGIETKTS